MVNICVICLHTVPYLQHVTVYFGLRGDFSSIYVSLEHSGTPALAKINPLRIRSLRDYYSHH